MLRRWLAPVVGSVFFRLLLVIVIAGVCINVTVGAFFMYLTMGYMQNMPFRTNWTQYLVYLVGDIGNPPDIERAAALADKLSITIGFEGPDGIWQSTDTLPPVDALRLKKISEAPPVYYGRSEGRRFLIVEDAGRRYMFDLMKTYSWQHFTEEKIIFLIAVLTVILLFGYCAIRWLLKPIRWLNDGVRQVSSGNLDYRLPVKRHDEFGRLAEAFNSMTGRIREMLHARERLLLDVSHELRSPITRMKVALEFLPDLPVTHTMRADIHDMDSMISEILEVQRLGSAYGRLNREHTDLGMLVQDVIADCEQSGPEIVFENSQPGSTAMIDRARMRTVIKNIIDNALKYSTPDGEPVRVTIVKQPARIGVQVRDAGQGIPGEDLPHVFEPFYRVDKARTRHTGGYGLGLSICKTIMDAHAGTIAVESELGRGTTVSLMLPAA